MTRRGAMTGLSLLALVARVPPAGPCRTVSSRVAGSRSAGRIS
jgi:hypothetical protein